MNFQRGVRREEPEISLIPLIDVVLVIIIFLMLTTTFSPVAGLEINLPTAQSEKSERPVEEVSVAVTAAGRVLIDGDAVDSDEVADIVQALRRVRAEADSDALPVVVINADAEAVHQRVVDVMQAAQQAGLSAISFAVQNPANE